MARGAWLRHVYCPCLAYGWSSNLDTVFSASLLIGKPFAATDVLNIMDNFF